MTQIKEISQDIFYDMLLKAYEEYKTATPESTLSKKYWYNKCYVHVYHMFNDENYDREKLQQFCLDHAPLDTMYIALSQNKSKSYMSQRTLIKRSSVSNIVIESAAEDLTKKLVYLVNELEPLLHDIKEILEK